MPKINNPFIVFILFGLWAALMYSNTFNSPFYYDDFINIVENPDVHWDKLSLDDVKKLSVWQGRPFSYLTFALNYYFGGLNVRGFHYVNTGIHILTAIGFFLFIESVLELPHLAGRFHGKSKNIAFIAALLWLTSPLQIQAVTYIVQRMAALAAMFYIYAMYFYLKGRLNSSRQRYLFYTLTFVSALLAFGSKENAYTLPLYLILFEIIVIRSGRIAFLSGKKVSVVLSIVMFLVIPFLGLLWGLYYDPLKAQVGSWFVYWLETRFLTGARVIIFYVVQLFFPVPSRLSLEHDFQLSHSLFDPPVTFFAVLFIAGMILYATVSLKKHPLFSFFTLWFLGNLATETFYPYIILIFEHRLYLPSMGFFAIAAMGLDRIITFQTGKGLRRLGIMGLLLIVTSFSINTYLRNDTWKDEYSLWNDVIKKSPGVPVGYVNLGDAYLRGENHGEAAPNFQKAISMDPRNHAARYGAGVAYYNMRMYDEAVAEFSYLGSMGYIGVGRGRSISYYFSRVAKNYYGHGRREAALEVLDKALLYDPNEPMLKELREKMDMGTITFEEIMRK